MAESENAPTNDEETKPKADAAEVDPNEAMAAEWAVMAEGGDTSGGENADPDAEIAAEWAALVEDETPGEEGADGEMLFGSSGVLGGASSQPTRVLNQDEIDSLLGFDIDDDDKG